MGNALCCCNNRQHDKLLSAEASYGSNLINSQNNPHHKTKPCDSKRQECNGNDERGTSSLFTQFDKITHMQPSIIIDRSHSDSEEYKAHSLDISITQPHTNGSSTFKYDIYIIGSNQYSELGFNHKDYKSIKQLTKMSWLQAKFITDINCSCYCNIYSDIKSQRFWVSGANDKGQCGINSDIQTVDNVWDINYFERQNINIKQIFCTVPGSAIFWMSEANRIYAHGMNEYYQLGLGTNDNKYEPVSISIPIEPNAHVISIKCAEKYSIVLCSDGSVYSAGDLRHGAYYDKQWKRMDVFNDKRIISIECGYNHSLFLESNGVLWSCGLNYNGQIGAGHFESDRSVLPAPIEYLVNNDIRIKDMRCGLYHNLVISDGNKIYSWGYNEEGECGNGRTENVHTPQLIDALKECDIKDINCGALHSYCMTFDDKHYLWGSNEYNECLSDEDMDKVIVPNLIDEMIDRVTNGKRIEKVCMGWDNTLVIVI